MFPHTVPFSDAVYFIFTTFRAGGPYLEAMFARLLGIPLFLFTLIGLYLSWEVDAEYSWMIILGVILVATNHVFSPQINWWWYTRHPLDLDPAMKTFLERFDLAYQQLGPVDKTRFRQRIALFKMGNEFMPQGWESVPEDIQVVISAAAVKVRFDEENLLFSNCEKIVVYPTAFPSPAHQQEWHSSEWFSEDGVVLFAADALMLGLMQPTKYLDLAVYEYCRIQNELTGRQHQNNPGDPWAEIHSRTGWTMEQVQQMIGLQRVDEMAVLQAIQYQPLFQVQGTASGPTQA